MPASSEKNEVEKAFREGYEEGFLSGSNIQYTQQELEILFEKIEKWCKNLDDKSPPPGSHAEDYCIYKKFISKKKSSIQSENHQTN